MRKIKMIFFTFVMMMLVCGSVSAASINKSALNLWKGDVYKQLKLSNTKVTKVVWSSSNNSVAKVSSKGVVTALKAGTSKITARSSSGTSLASCKVTIKNQPVINGAEWIYVKDPKQPAINYRKKYSVSNTFTAPSWSTSNAHYVAIASNRLYMMASAIGPTKEFSVGTTTLTATVKSDASTKKLKKTVKTKLYPRLESGYTVGLGQTVIVEVHNTTKTPDYSFDSKYVKVTRNGRKLYVTGVKTGETNFYVSFNKGQISLKTKIQIKPASSVVVFQSHEITHTASSRLAPALVAKDYTNMTNAEKLSFDVMYKFMTTPSNGGDFATDSGYPEGRRCSNSDYYRWVGGVYRGGYGCAGFAFRMSDAIFDEVSKYYPINLACKKFSSFSSSTVKVGDILRMDNDSHTVIVLQKKSNGVVVAEGNYNNTVHWGRFISFDYIRENFNYILTRWYQE